ncbi:hypothetical protein [Streptomyces sp. PD-S100-1]|uniref:hypothetical protein n=1 Tax=Streptomyces sp. PD-S100-1 TaxID=3394351 RepID=UPI0039BD7AB8
MSESTARRVRSHVLDDPTPCLLFAGHDARHTFEFDMATNRQGLLHRALTVSDLRSAIEGLDDGTAVRIGAVATAFCATSSSRGCSRRVGEGGVERLAPGGGVDLALVLLIGPASVDQSDREAV